MVYLRVDQASVEDARALLRTCCGSARWIEQMLERRPFGSVDALVSASRDIWFALAPADWQEAFADHPKIGDREALKKKFEETRHLASQEQAGVVGASDDVLDALARGNREYERKFGYIFIVCASGLDANQMLGMLNARLVHDATTELRIAAQEQSKITELRLKNL
jgi:2-oxo-4-hydroxy-4-carboxy-5-ureidoimidazoline decarboxylase